MFETQKSRQGYTNKQYCRIHACRFYASGVIRAHLWPDNTTCIVGKSMLKFSMSMFIFSIINLVCSIWVRKNLIIDHIGLTVNRVVLTR